MAQHATTFGEHSGDGASWTWCRAACARVRLDWRLSAPGGLSARGGLPPSRFATRAPRQRHLHTAATVLLLLGVSERAVMGQMGWSHSAMTARYQHITAAVRHDIAERIGGLIWPSNLMSNAVSGDTETASATDVPQGVVADLTRGE